MNVTCLIKCGNTAITEYASCMINELYRRFCGPTEGFVLYLISHDSDCERFCLSVLYKSTCINWSTMDVASHDKVIGMSLIGWARNWCIAAQFGERFQISMDIVLNILKQRSEYTDDYKLNWKWGEKAGTQRSCQSGGKRKLVFSIFKDLDRLIRGSSVCDVTRLDHLS